MRSLFSFKMIYSIEQFEIYDNTFKFSNSKSKISDTAKEHDFVVFSNRPRIFHE